MVKFQMPSGVGRIFHTMTPTAPGPCAGVLVAFWYLDPNRLGSADQFSEPVLDIVDDFAITVAALLPEPRQYFVRRKLAPSQKPRCLFQRMFTRPHTLALKEIKEITQILFA